MRRKVNCAEFFCLLNILGFIGCKYNCSGLVETVRGKLEVSYGTAS